MTHVNENGGNGIPLKQKLNEPILNAKQMTALIMAILYNIIADLLPLLMGEDVNITWILINLGVSVAVYLMLSLMRAAGIKEVPNMSVVNNLKLFFERIIDNIVVPQDKEAGAKLKILEDIIVWTVREWDAINNKELSTFGEYFRHAIEKAIDEGDDLS